MRVRKVLPHPEMTSRLAFIFADAGGCPATIDRYFKIAAVAAIGFLPLDYKMVKVPLKEVKMVEGVKDYIRIHYSVDKPALLVRMSMKNMEEMLEGAGFLRIHKSYIISIHHLTAIRKNAVFIGNTELPVGEQYREAIARLAGGE